MRIAINTGGGDAPGLNAVIRAITKSALNHGWEVFGIREGYNGLFRPELYEKYPDKGMIQLTHRVVRGITHLGGTILGTTNRGNPLQYPMQREDGTWYEKDRMDEVIAGLKKYQIDAVVAIGGDGSLTIANELNKRGVRVIGVPKTIDNDLNGTVATFGFDTAMSFAADSLGRLHSTAEAHQRIMVVEVMGRYAGWIALESGVAGTADVILIPEIPYDINKIAARIKERESWGRHFSIVVVAEGAKPVGGELTVKGKSIGQAERLGGVGELVTKKLEELTGKEARCVVLGHLQRGGIPTPYDRLISLRFGSAAVRALEDGMSGVMVALDPPTVKYVPLAQAAKRLKTVPLDCDTIATARDLGIIFGD